MPRRSQFAPRCGGGCTVSDFTGERVVPGLVNDDLWAEHLSRYSFAARYASGAKLLDIGCGTGYGTAELARSARLAFGIDISADALEYAVPEYGLENVRFLQSSASQLPFAPETFDVITAFEVIEHIPDWDMLIAEARRTLRPNGLFFVSTPNRLYYTESRGNEGPNPYHVHEFTYDEFTAALRKHFPHCTMFLQNPTEAFAFYPHRVFLPVDADFHASRGKPDEAYFFLGVCSIAAPPQLNSLVYVPQASNRLREREKHIESLQRELAEARSQLAALHEAHNKQTRHLEDQNRWALKTVAELEEARKTLANLQKEFDERTKWALDLAARVQTHEALLNMLRESRWLKLGRKLNLGPDLGTKDDTRLGGK
jgi:ubiquinone/menaquinone biosynthesis C-methylase UbiE